MIRGKTVIKKIENMTSRQVTFSKRKSGLFKKAKELGILCDAEVGVILFSITGRLYEYSNFRMKSTIDRYRLVKEGQQLLSSSAEAKLWQAEAARLEQQVNILREKQRLLLGHHLTGLSLEEVKCLENQIEMSLHNIGLTKDKLMGDETEELNKNETIARQENTELHRKLNIIRQENMDLKNKAEVKRGIQSYNSATPHGKHSIFLEHSHSQHAERGEQPESPIQGKLSYPEH